ncbi:DUF6452 family protein [Pricia sp. S334]|uniref:DUF6452 family protein n=1 Tax=Pricia mediterranea TaxID=3076079 RepID=A0ABU3L8C4_9FLAO|nr:DUF6452 family protein [Pricia sp. S334]MDT7829935.1 DUF6452 family protein [Pricia sp. S334]
MRKLRIPLIVLLGILSFSACEKDDICIDADTPRLVIRFMDALDTTLSKDVQNLVVIGVGETGLRDTIPNLTLDSIVLPLRPGKSSTTFTFSRQTSITDINIDTLSFTYNPKEVFASRACGYVVRYDSLQAAVQQDDSLWLQRIAVDSSFIENTASTHVRIFH